MERSPNNPFPELGINISTAQRDSDIQQDTCSELSEEVEAAAVGFSLPIIRNLARVQKTREPSRYLGVKYYVDDTPRNSRSWETTVSFWLSVSGVSGSQS